SVDRVLSYISFEKYISVPYIPIYHPALPDISPSPTSSRTSNQNAVKGGVHVISAPVIRAPAHTHTHTHSLSLSHSHTPSHTLTHTLTHTHTHTHTHQQHTYIYIYIG